jgi:hypothetical protein
MQADQGVTKRPEARQLRIKRLPNAIGQQVSRSAGKGVDQATEYEQDEEPALKHPGGQAKQRPVEVSTGLCLSYVLNQVGGLGASGSGEGDTRVGCGWHPSNRRGRLRAVQGSR